MIFYLLKKTSKTKYNELKYRLKEKTDAVYQISKNYIKTIINQQIVTNMQ